MVSSQVVEEAGGAGASGVELVDLAGGTRICTSCGAPKDFSQYGANQNHPTGYFKTCKECRAANRPSGSGGSHGRSPRSATSSAVEVGETYSVSGLGAVRMLPRISQVPQNGHANRASRRSALGVAGLPKMQRSLKNLLMMRAMEAHGNGTADDLVYPVPVEKYHAHFILQGDMALDVDLPEFLDERGPAPAGYDWKVCLLCGFVSLQFMNSVLGQEVAPDQVPDTSPWQLPARLVEEANTIFHGYASGYQDSALGRVDEEPGEVSPSPSKTSPDSPPLVVFVEAGDAVETVEIEGFQGIEEPAGIELAEEPGVAESVADVSITRISQHVHFYEGDRGDEVQPEPALAAISELPAAAPMTDAELWGILSPRVSEVEEIQEIQVPGEHEPAVEPSVDWKSEAARLRMEANDAWTQTVILQGTNESLEKSNARLREMVACLGEQNSRLEAEECHLRDELSIARLKLKSTEISLQIAVREREIVELRFEQWKVESRMEDLETPPALPRTGATEWLSSAHVEAMPEAEAAALAGTPGAAPRDIPRSGLDAR